MSLPNPGMSFDPLTPLPAESLNDLVENIEALAAGTGLNAGVIPYAALLSNIFSSLITTDTNPGNAGGSRNYLNLGGLKICWGVTASKTHAAGASGNYAVTFPASFFSSTPTATCSIQTASGSVGSNNLVGVGVSSSTFTIGWGNETGSAGVGGTAAWIAIGV